MQPPQVGRGVLSYKGQGRKAFFFEKKKQKAFVRAVAVRWQATDRASGAVSAATKKDGEGRNRSQNKASGSFLKKRTKKLLLTWWTLPERTATAPAKAFCFFFSKKKAFLNFYCVGNVQIPRPCVAAYSSPPGASFNW